MLIDRNRGINLDEFFGPGYSLLETSINYVDLLEIDPDKIVLKHYLKDRETHITGIERRKRILDSGDISLDLGVWQAFIETRETQALIPQAFKDKGDRYARYIFFERDLILNPFKKSCTPCCHLSEIGKWNYAVRDIEQLRRDIDLSAVLIL